jgi:hypothetical protein
MKGFVMCRSANSPLEFSGAPARLPEDTAKDVPGSPEGTGGETRHRGLEFAHKTVATPIAKKLKLKTPVSRVIIVVTRKLNQ